MLIGFTLNVNMINIDEKNRVMPASLRVCRLFATLADPAPVRALW